MLKKIKTYFIQDLYLQTSDARLIYIMIQFLSQSTIQNLIYNLKSKVDVISQEKSIKFYL